MANFIAQMANNISSWTLRFKLTISSTLKIGYNKIDSKDHALFKVKDKIILIHKFIDPKGNQISNDINLLITNSNVFIVELNGLTNSIDSV
jgi:hypothetical protein